MAKLPEYRLKTLLHMRERAKDLAEQALSQRMAELRAEQERLRALEEELERMIQMRETKKREYAEKQMRGEVSAQGAIAARTYLERLKEQEALQEEAIEAQHGVIAQRKEAVNAARDVLVQANQELKALEKHKEKWAKKLKMEWQRKEEIKQDEIAQGIYQRRSR